MIEQLIDIKELSKLIGVQKPTLYHWVNRKSVPYLKIGGLVKFKPSEVEQWMNSRAVAVDAGTVEG